MTPQLLFGFFSADSLQSFELFLADGRVISVDNPELFSTAEDSQSFLLFRPPDIREYFDAALIVSVKMKEAIE